MENAKNRNVTRSTTKWCFEKILLNAFQIDIIKWKKKKKKTSQQLFRLKTKTKTKIFYQMKMGKHEDLFIAWWRIVLCFFELIYCCEFLASDSVKFQCVQLTIQNRKFTRTLKIVVINSIDDNGYEFFVFV